MSSSEQALTSSASSMYIDLLKKMLIDYHRLEYDEYQPLTQKKKIGYKLLTMIDKPLGRAGYHLCKRRSFQQAERIEGKDWPAYADSMIGLHRLNNIESCVESILRDNIAGDLIETGVWRGGACIFMQALLKIHGALDRRVWVADSFEGLPPPDAEKYEADLGDTHYQKAELAISLETVRRNFEKYGLLDANVKFLKGWFSETLPAAPIQELALIRLDGDMYESTMDGLVNLYPKLNPGGYLIVDDWGAVPACKQAVLDYRQRHGILEEIQIIDWTGAYWRKT